jgi:replication factor A2
MGGSQGGSQGGGKTSYAKDTLRPVTILQALEAHQPHPDADFKLDNVEITQISFVGQIRNVAKQATNMTFKLDDGTGTIEVKQWVDNDEMPLDGETTSAKKQPEVGDWVKVWGKLKAFNNKRHVGVHVIRPIEDKNEINHHLLEATYVHLFFTRGPPEQLSAGGTAGQQGARQQQQQGGGMETGYEQNRPLPNMSMQARSILKCLRETPQGNEGLHAQNIASVTRLTIPEVMKASEELVGLSMIFTTVDDNTWALLDT